MATHHESITREMMKHDTKTKKIARQLGAFFLPTYLTHGDHTVAKKNGLGSYLQSNHMYMYTLLATQMDIPNGHLVVT